MSVVETIPMTTTPEAEAFLDREGQRAPFEASPSTSTICPILARPAS